MDAAEVVVMVVFAKEVVLVLVLLVAIKTAHRCICEARLGNLEISLQFGRRRWVERLVRWVRAACAVAAAPAVCP